MKANRTIPEFELKSDELRETNFHFEVLGENADYDPSLPHRHDYYEIFFFEKGGGIHIIDFEEITICEGDIHILSPGQIHYMNRCATSSGKVIKFTAEFCLSQVNDKDILKRIPFLNERITDPVLKPSPEKFTDILVLVDHIEKENHQKTVGYQNMIHNYLSAILMTFHRLSSNSPSLIESNERICFNSFISLLEQSFMLQQKVSYYSTKLNISQDKLSQSVKQVTGKSPSDVITKRLLLEAKRLLLHSNMSVKEIAFHLNFQDNAYFNRWFKKREQISPGNFRTVTREKYHT